MTATAERETGLPLADYLGTVLRGVRPLPALDLDLTQAHGNTLAEDVIAPGPLPAFDHAAIDGYAARCEDVAPATASRPVRLNVVGDLTASSWRPVRLTPGTCFSVAAGGGPAAGARRGGGGARRGGAGAAGTGGRGGGGPRPGRWGGPAAAAGGGAGGGGARGAGGGCRGGGARSGWGGGGGGRGLL